MKTAVKRLLGILVVAVGSVTVAGRIFAATATTSQVQSAISSNNSWLAGVIAGNLLYALASWFEIGLYLVWLAVTWSVIELYTLIGTYIIPIWDFSNGVGFFNLPTETSAWSIVSVPTQASTLLWAVVPWLLGICGMAMVTAASITVPKSISDGREPFEAGAGLIWGTSLIVVFPLLYSVPIHVGNLVARGFYQAAVTTPANQQNSLFNALLTNSLFPDIAEGNGSTPSLATGLSTLSTGGVAQVAGSTLTNNLANTVSFAGSGTSQTAQLGNTFSNMMTSIYANGGSGIALSTNYAAQGMSVVIETYASRLIQILLGLWGIFELVGVLILKGGQIIALILNFYLGWIACALYAFPGTRAVFWGWLKAHITLCLWGLIWAMLIFIMNIIVAAGNGLQGMTTDSTGVMVFAGVGLFLMPFILFGGIHKFKQVATLSTGLAATSQLAQTVASGVQGGFSQGLQKVQSGSGPYSDVGTAAKWKSGGAKVGGLMEGMGGTWGKGMSALASKASMALNAVPGVGPMAGAMVKAGAQGMGAVGAAAAQGVKHSNPFAGYQRLNNRQQAPEPNNVLRRAGLSGSSFSRAMTGSQASGQVPEMPDQKQGSYNSITNRFS